MLCELVECYQVDVVLQGNIQNMSRVPCWEMQNLKFLGQLPRLSVAVVLCGGQACMKRKIVTLARCELEH